MFTNTEPPKNKELPRIQYFLSFFHLLEPVFWDCELLPLGTLIRTVLSTLSAIYPFDKGSFFFQQVFVLA
uniref:Predicted protein n=1 Tax=Hordeum vulgare subsp. vulgare TaxID=112509 RepID=F2DZQ6_HORVV|nr:predicted protein [Hordeum vulgare subsp. vulgare]